ncbi:helix-turn-helix domain-containing protein [Streptomyces iconiensis]|uniref:Helix-turn-helix domain-containing protein n=1 Tax=Streptomyces iconiensis TaxID=1384038 RepID=A0ABT7A3I1_9ACTN|nr:helix-turn-helix domain-containing protein [Streptomyces iconiensis]MDJ1135903.1 helix-turn-helix domain-containing protein [Streptomyces iconiensis]
MAGFRAQGSGPIDIRAIPHPAVTLALAFNPGTLVVEDATGRRPGALVAGLAFSDLQVRGRDMEAVQIRLSPLLAYTTLGTSAAELEGAVVALDELWGRDAERVQEQLSEAPSWQDRFALLDTLLVRRYEAGRPERAMPPEVAHAWNRIVRACGRIRVEELAAEVGWSRQRLWARFRSHIGLTPHRAAKLVRFHHAAHRLAAGRTPAGAAAESGYYDQSHLHRNVRAFTGITPTTLADEPFLAVDDLAWPGQAPPVTRTGRSPEERKRPPTDPEVPSAR